MRTMPNMVDMALTPKEAEEEYSAPAYDSSKGPKYPWGLSIRLTQEELDKLGLSASDVEVGDVVEICGLAKVTSVSSSETQEGANSCVELQIIALSSEDDDDDDEEAAEPVNPVKSFYG